MRPIAGIAPTPSAATLAAKNFRRAGFARDGWQHRQVRKNLTAELALIPSSRFCCGASLALVPALFQAQTPRISRSRASPMSRRKPAIVPTAEERFAQALTSDPTPPQQRIAAIRRVRAVQPAEPSRQ